MPRAPTRRILQRLLLSPTCRLDAGSAFGHGKCGAHNWAALRRSPSSRVSTPEGSPSLVSTSTFKTMLATQGGPEDTGALAAADHAPPPSSRVSNEPSKALASLRLASQPESRRTVHLLRRHQCYRARTHALAVSINPSHTIIASPRLGHATFRALLSLSLPLSPSPPPLRSPPPVTPPMRHTATNVAHGTATSHSRRFRRHKNAERCCAEGTKQRPPLRLGIRGGLLGSILSIHYIHILVIHTNNMIYILYTNWRKWGRACLLSVTTSSTRRRGLPVLWFQKKGADGRRQKLTQRGAS